jgi:ParB-like chromosome segregation protein Spo0J
MNIETIKAKKLNPAPYNPRKDLRPGDTEYENLRRAIDEFGYVEPIVWNKRTGNIVGGHQRFKVLRDLGYAEVECVVLDIDEMREKALNVALNKINGAWDETKLAELLGDLDASDFDVTLTGFDMDEIATLLDMTGLPDELALDKDKAGTKNRVAQWHVGKYAVTVSQEEIAALEIRIAKYLSTHGTAVGFFGALMGGTV